MNHEIESLKSKEIVKLEREREREREREKENCSVKVNDLGIFPNLDINKYTWDTRGNF